MSSAGALLKPPQDRLIFLAETVLAEAALLRITDSRVFAVPMDAERAASLRHDIDRGWVDSAADWIECRQLRNFMTHEYVRDMTVVAVALSRGHLAVPLLETSAQRLAGQVHSAVDSVDRLNLTGCAVIRVDGTIPLASK